MARKAKTLKDSIVAARPDIAPVIDRQALKASVAQILRELRKSAKMTQVQVAEASGLDQSVISKMESPMGALPALDTVQRYALACNGHMFMGVSSGAIAAQKVETVLSENVQKPVFALSA